MLLHADQVGTQAWRGGRWNDVDLISGRSGYRGNLTRNDEAIIGAAMIVSNGALGHIVLNVADLKKSERFYRSILGLKVSARNLITKMTFLSYGR